MFNMTKKFILILLLPLVGACSESSPVQNNKESIKYYITAKPHYKISQAIFITIKLSNNTKRDITFLKWGTPLDSHVSKDMFSIKIEEQELPYQGRIFKRGKPTIKDYITIKPNESILNTINISQAYSFKHIGKYSIKYRSSHLQQHNYSNNTSLITIQSSNQISIRISQ